MGRGSNTGPSMLHTTKHRESTSSPSPLRLFGGERLYWREYRRRRESELPITALEQDSYRENRTAKSTTSRETQRDVRGRGAQSEHVYNRGVHRFCRRLGQPASLSPAPYSTQPLQSVGSHWLELLRLICTRTRSSPSSPSSVKYHSPRTPAMASLSSSMGLRVGSASGSIHESASIAERPRPRDQSLRPSEEGEPPDACFRSLTRTEPTPAGADDQSGQTSQPAETRLESCLAPHHSAGDAARAAGESGSYCRALPQSKSRSEQSRAAAALSFACPMRAASAPPAARYGCSRQQMLPRAEAALYQSKALMSPEHENSARFGLHIRPSPRQPPSCGRSEETYGRKSATKYGKKSRKT